MNLIRLVYQWLTPFTFSILLILIILFKYTKRLVASPISNLPGPIYTSLSHLPIIYQDWISNRTLWTLELHRRYGSIVRLSPTEVSISSPDLIREVFVSSKQGGGGYPKAPVFNIFQHFGARNAFSSIESEDHSWRRRLVGGLYTQSAVLRKEVTRGRLWALVGDFLNGVEREGVEGKRVNMGKVIDLSSFCTYYGTDGITSHLFRPGSSSTALQGTLSHRSFIAASRESSNEVITYFKMDYERAERFYFATRTLFRGVGKYIGLGGRFQQKPVGRTRLNIKGSGKKDNLSPGAKFYGGSEIEDWGYRRYRETKERVEDGEFADVVAETLAQNVIEGDQKVRDHGEIELPIGDDIGLRLFEGQDKKYYRDDGAASECMDQFLAGRDTTGDSLSYTIHLLSLPANVTIQSLLHTEIQSLGLPVSHSQPLSQDQITALIKAPYLDSVIKETLRIHPASTVSLQRSVPAGGRNINGFFIPEDTVIGATPMETNTSLIFASSASLTETQKVQDINSWIPERWVPSASANTEEIEKQKDKITEMERRMWTFGSGGRGCIGKHVAMLEMKLLLAGIYRKYRTEIDNESELLITHDDWSRRTTFRDIPYFPKAKGVVRFVAI